MHLKTTCFDAGDLLSSRSCNDSKWIKTALLGVDMYHMLSAAALECKTLQSQMCMSVYHTHIVSQLDAD